jgi:4-oxalocrotonate tautomerase
MPVIHVYAFERTRDQKRALVKEVTEATCRTYDVPPEIVTVYLFDVPKGNAAHGGVLAADEDEKKARTETDVGQRDR